MSGSELQSLAETEPCSFKFELLPDDPVFDNDVDELFSLDIDEPRKGADPNGKDEDQDTGYFSMCQTPSLRSPPASTPNRKESEDKIHPPSKRSVKRPNPAVCGLSLDFTVESIGRDVKIARKTGLPLPESSVCVKECESRSETYRKVHLSKAKSLPDCDNLVISFKGKSVARVVSQPTTSSSQANKDLSKKKLPASIPSTNKDATRVRPVVFNTEADWEREKGIYIKSVQRHIHERSGAAQDAVSEVWHLMMQVGHDSSGKPWQHPSDLTHRNFRARTGHQPKMSLSEWQGKNRTTYKRFKNMEKRFF
ncbi:S100P-binding protein-like [Corythoichthys intestinalis]|uniref:S100P-binding protein-like n=1 Tax=Corythoichthys intestinalis TaxID=161448 RepID=UPI0025A613CC|nr:S100P-binding protein-like [Corythoichthys intestinalis]